MLSDIHHGVQNCFLPVVLIGKFGFNWLIALGDTVSGSYGAAMNG